MGDEGTAVTVLTTRPIFRHLSSRLYRLGIVRNDSISKRLATRIIIISNYCFVTFKFNAPPAGLKVSLGK